MEQANVLQTAPKASKDQRLRQTLTGRLAALASKHPSQTALREKHQGIWREISWQEYYENTQAVGYMLWELGIRPKDHVAILSDNCPEWLYADLGAQALGARSVGIYQTNPPSDVAYILKHSKSKLLFCEDQEQLDKAIEIADETPFVETIVLFDPRGTRHYQDQRVLHWSTFIKKGKELQKQKPDWFEQQLLSIDPEEASMVIYTSGTTGPPKGALLSSANVTSTSDQTAELLGVTKHDTLLSYLPLCHVAEKIFTLFLPLTAGSIVHFGESIYTIQDDLREVSPTIFLGVPRIWEKIHAGVQVKMQDSSWLKRKLYQYWSRKGAEVAKKRSKQEAGMLDKLAWFLGDLFLFRPLQERLGLRRCILPVSGAAPISAELIQWFHGIGVPILEGFGQTECAGVSHINLPQTSQIGTVGQALPFVECEIDDSGEILLRGPHVFVGYLHDSEATAKTVDEQGWLHTGDIGEVDDKGFLRITGRKKEFIITSGGKNLSPEKIENSLKLSPFIKEAIAIGDTRKFISALVQIEYDMVGDWATRQKIPYTSFEDLSSKPEVLKLIQQELNRANESLARVESIRKFKLIPKELSQDDGELTATQKVRRREIHKIYHELIESMY